MHDGGSEIIWRMATSRMRDTLEVIPEEQGTLATMGSKENQTHGERCRWYRVNGMGPLMTSEMMHRLYDDRGCWEREGGPSGLRQWWIATVRSEWATGTGDNQTKEVAGCTSCSTELAVTELETRLAAMCTEFCVRTGMELGWVRKRPGVGEDLCRGEENSAICRTVKDCEALMERWVRRAWSAGGPCPCMERGKRECLYAPEEGRRGMGACSALELNGVLQLCVYARLALFVIRMLSESLFAPEAAESAEIERWMGLLQERVRLAMVKALMGAEVVFVLFPEEDGTEV